MWPTASFIGQEGRGGRTSVGDAGGANGREVDGGVVFWKQVGGAWITRSEEAGNNPRKGEGPGYLTETRVGLTREERRVVSCVESRPV